ncbi:DUF3231 family protein [Litchfieldia salsa]|uniref:DUF3231 family protein n=1 Tax=Litchfieldia salsa TaxID=930152 RepID=A0A1H0UPW4_9BACI|nr:DUF3231 family protein [Litchfieldia salsa]SDP68191.1 Protein of unknown function [Litchfieldia salsa]
MTNHKSIPITSSELGYLWTGFSINDMSKWFLTAFLGLTKDEEIKDLYVFALQITNDLLSERNTILNNEGYPVPIGFSEEDIELNATPLFSNRFLLKYLHTGARLGLEFHSKSLALSTRADVRQYNINCLKSSIRLNDKIVDLLLKKGIYWRTPTLPAPHAPEYIQKSSYLNSWFGDTRPLNSMELANLYQILDLLIIMEALCIGFEQTAKLEETLELVREGMTSIKNQYNTLTDLLKRNNLPIPSSYSAEVIDSKERVFSDRIMVTHLAGLYGSLISQYGFSLGAVMRHDLVKMYTQQIVRAGVLSESITRFLIEKEWIEKIPGALSREV